MGAEASRREGRAAGRSDLWRRLPMVGLVAGCLLGVACAELGAAGLHCGWLVGAGGAVMGVVGLTGGRAGKWQVVLAVVGCLVFWGLHSGRLRDQRAVAGWLGTGELVTFECEVLELREGGPLQPDALVRVSGRLAERDGEVRGARIAVRGTGGDVLPGDLLRLRGRGRNFPDPRNPGERDSLRRMRRAGWAGELRVETVEPVGSRPWVPRRWAWRAREVIGERIVAGLDPEGDAAAVIRALVLGDRSGDQVELFGAFRRSGTMHVFAVSGLHVGMVALLAWGLLWFGRVPRGWGLWLVLAVVWSYAMVTGLRPPAMRASIMATVLLLGFVLRRGPALGNALLASVPLVLGIDSFQWRQPGFQLSYVVVAAIILIAPGLFRRMRPFVEGDAFLPRVLYTKRQKVLLLLRGKVAALGAVSVAAWFGSMPLMWAHFGIVTPVAILASMVLVPVVFAILALALCGLLAGLLFLPAEGAINQVNGMIANASHRVASGFSSLPGAYIETHREAWWGRGMVVFDLRRGDGASYFGAGGGCLIDAGSEREFRRVVYPALRKAGAEVDSLVISHADGGHCGGMARAVGAWGPVQALVPVETARSPFFKRFQGAARTSNCPVLLGEPGRRFPVAREAVLEVLYAPMEGEGSVADDRGMVLKLHWHGWRILMTGDTGFETEQRLLERGVDVTSDVWVMGHHGADHTGTMAFLRAVQPKVIIASEAPFPEAERIPEWWAHMVRDEGVALWNQGATGAVALEAGPQTLQLRAFLDEKRVMVLRK